MAINEAAVLMCLLVEVPHGWQAKVSETMTKFRKVFLAQHLRFSPIRTPSHAGDSTTFALCSLSYYFILGLPLLKPLFTKDFSAC